MQILVIGNGFGHNAQLVQNVDDGATLRALKTEFGGLLKKRIVERDVQFIGEEAEFGVTTIAQCLGPRRENIDMPSNEREVLGIAGEQQSRPVTPTYLGDEAKTQMTVEGYQKLVSKGWVLIEHRVPSDTIREQYMFDKTMREAKGASSLIVICGIAHGHFLAGRFRGVCNEVEVELWQPK